MALSECTGTRVRLQNMHEPISKVDVTLSRAFGLSSAETNVSRMQNVRVG